LPGFSNVDEETKLALISAWTKHNHFEADIWLAEIRYQMMSADVEAQRNDLNRAKELLLATRRHLGELFDSIGQPNAIDNYHKELRGTFFSPTFQHMLIQCRRSAK
jgi:hypothetical protein